MKMYKVFIILFLMPFIAFSQTFIEPQMVKVKGGTFQMRCQTYENEKPDPVKVSDFYIGKYEVTQAEWRSVMGEDPKELAHFKGDNMPVHTVNWDDIQAFLQKINAQTGKQYRLPSEAEWEFAARGGNESKGYIYSGSNNVDSVAWMDGNANHKPHPVGGRTANELGIYDMSGNVWEWCSDWYKSYLGCHDGADYTGLSRVCRGGCWFSNPTFGRSSIRSDGKPTERGYCQGFRLALSSL